MVNSFLIINKLKKTFNGLHALNDFSCDISRGEIIGLFGPNGAGKTTLFNILTGFLPADSGEVFFDSKNLLKLSPQKIARKGISRTFQNLRLVRQVSVMDNVMLAIQDLQNEKVFRSLFCRTRLNNSEAHNRGKAMNLLSQTGLADKASAKAESLSYGQQKLLNLVMCLASEAELMLLDEPVAGIAPNMRRKILEIIEKAPEEGKTVVFIEHDMEAIMDVCSRLIFMDAGRKICEGLPDEVRNAPEVIEAYMK